MPIRNKFPTLQELAVRRLSRPDAVNRSEKEHYPSTNAFIRNKIELAYIKDKDSTFNQLLEQNKLDDLSNTIVNNWIRLSHYYKTPLIEFRQTALFLALQAVTCLDFLSYCTQLFHDPDCIPEFPSLIGFVPFMSRPLKVDPPTWMDIVDILSITKADADVEILCIYFGKPTSKTGPTSFEFSKTIQGFYNLKKLVVHGEANDNLLQTIGRCCAFLEYLDIRGARVTETGILKLLFKRPQDVRKYTKLEMFDHSVKIPPHALRPLTKRLIYFDMSTIKKSKILYEHYHPVLVACPDLVVTQRALFFKPKGNPRILCKINEDISEFHLKIMQNMRSTFCLPLLDFIRELKTYFNVTEFELRTNDVGEEIGFLFYEKMVLVVHVEISNYDIVSIISHASSSLAFLSIDLLNRYCPNLYYIKASLGYVVNPEKGFPNLKSVTAAVIENKNVLFLIICNCKNLKYLEVREILKALGPLDDKDLDNCFQKECQQLEVVRFLFPNKITLCGGIKQILKFCPRLRLIGDLKFFHISYEYVIGSLISLSLHNFEFMYEYDGTLHHTTTPFGQLKCATESFTPNF